MLIIISILTVLSLLMMVFLVAALGGCDKFEVPRSDKTDEIEHKSLIQKIDTETL